MGRGHGIGTWTKHKVLGEGLDVQLQVGGNPGRLDGRDIRSDDLTVRKRVGEVAEGIIRSDRARGMCSTTYMAQEPVPVAMSTTF